MATRGPSTKEHLLQLVDDIEMISKELLETITCPKPEKAQHLDQSQLVQLVLSKNEELQDTLKVAASQSTISTQLAALQATINMHDQDIQTLQKHLKEGETLLSTALYQAKQKLDQLTKAQTKSINSEDLVRFAHRISSTNAVAAPSNWVAGDQRRPYPTDLEMRMGLLNKIAEVPISQVLESIGGSGSGGSAAGPNSAGMMTSFPHWMGAQGAGSDRVEERVSVYASSFGVGFGGAGGGPAGDVDVEVMSTDSSSSSSSDSQ